MPCDLLLQEHAEVPAAAFPSVGFLQLRQLFVEGIDQELSLVDRLFSTVHSLASRLLHSLTSGHIGFHDLDCVLAIRETLE